jgi:hypothetical protein
MGRSRHSRSKINGRCSKEGRTRNLAIKRRGRHGSNRGGSSHWDSRRGRCNGTSIGGSGCTLVSAHGPSRGGIAPILSERIVQCFVSQRHRGAQFVGEIGSTVPFNPVDFHSHSILHNNHIHVTQRKSLIAYLWLGISKILKVQVDISIESHGTVAAKNKILTRIDPHIIQNRKILGCVGTSRAGKRPSQQPIRRTSTIVQLKPLSGLFGRRFWVSHNFVDENGWSRWGTLIGRSWSTAVTETSGPQCGGVAPVDTLRVVQCCRNQRHGGTLLIWKGVACNAPLHTIYFHAKRVLHYNVVLRIIQFESSREIA